MSAAQTASSGGSGGNGDHEALLTVIVAAEVAAWTQYCLLVEGGGEASATVLAVQGLALGLRSAASWLQVR